MGVGVGEAQLHYPVPSTTTTTTTIAKGQALMGVGVVGGVNEYVFMVQARGIQIRENVKNIGAQVLEQVVRGAYSVNGTDYTYDFNLSESEAPPTTYLPEDFTYLPLEVNITEISLEEVEQSLLDTEPGLAPGGYWKPADCQPRWKVAILIPFRNRREHLPILFRHLVPTGTEPFNRAMLFNVGFKEAMKDLDWNCLVFHDVDHLMENDRNYYGCTDMPRHFAVKLNKYSYMLPYNEFFGGVSGLTVEQYKKINGFPNAFWGWGGEDDDLWNRVQLANYTVSRPQGELGMRQGPGSGVSNLNYSPRVSRRAALQPTYGQPHPEPGALSPITGAATTRME
ncbi:hypothetical protein CRUP_014007 [Coryphaenoides rupestris]|nr:hypothetical protein CRUP_014007 [Coryphaenoides rupestris]